MQDEYVSQVDGPVYLVDHAIEKMLERSIPTKDLGDALARPDQTYLQAELRSRYQAR